MEAIKEQELELGGMGIAVVGHVDHGKSTIIGRLLADTGSLPEGKLEMIREMCRRNAKPFEYAFLLDALKDERSQGITIDTARCFFKTAKRNYIIIDAPGHVEFLKNMVTGASRAEAALLVIDALEGVRENTRRHGYLLPMLGVAQIVVVVNKMDLVDYSEEVFNGIVREYNEFLGQIGVEPSCYVPVSGMSGDNIAGRSDKMHWYQGRTILEVLDEFQAETPPVDKPFRMPVQDVYKFTRGGDARRIIAGNIESGRLHLNDEVVFYPSGKKSTVKTIEAFNKEKQVSVEAGWAAGFTLSEQIYVKRGDIAVVAGQTRPEVTSRLRARLFWLGNDPLLPDKTYMLKIGSAKAEARLERIIQVIDASTLNTAEKGQVEKHEIAEVILHLDRAIAFDLYSILAATGRFVLVDRYEIAGGGVILEALEDKQSQVRDKVITRNYKWEKSNISPEERIEKHNQKAALLLVTGPQEMERKAIAKGLEAKLFHDGKLVYFLGIGSVLYGVDADLKGIKSNSRAEQREEHLRRLAEVSHIMLDAGMILIVTASELTRDDLEIIKMVDAEDRIITVWVGGDVTTDVSYDLHIPEIDSTDMAVGILKNLLQEKGIIFTPW